MFFFDQKFIEPKMPEASKIPYYFMRYWSPIIPPRTLTYIVQLPDSPDEDKFEIGRIKLG